MKLNVNTDAVKDHTARLRKLHKSALPLAIRGTLNNAAFDVKKETMPESARKSFTNRVPNFFKANSKVDMARGWNVDMMQATVGFVEGKLTGQKNYAVKDLEQQEQGGTIKAKAFIPTRKARGNNESRPIRPTNRLSRINNIVNSEKNKAKGTQQFIRSAVHAGAKGYIIGNKQTKMLLQITSIRRMRNRKIKIRTRAIYSYEQSRSVRVKSTGFMRRASLKSADKMEKWYQEQAEKQIKRLTT